MKKKKGVGKRWVGLLGVRHMVWGSRGGGGCDVPSCFTYDLEKAKHGVEGLILGLLEACCHGILVKRGCTNSLFLRFSSFIVLAYTKNKVRTVLLNTQ